MTVVRTETVELMGAAAALQGNAFLRHYEAIEEYLVKLGDDWMQDVEGALVSPDSCKDSPEVSTVVVVWIDMGTRRAQKRAKLFETNRWPRISHDRRRSTSALEGTK